MRAHRGVLAGALLLAASLLGPTSYADTAADKAGDTSPAAQTAPRADRAAKPVVRIGQLLGSSPTEKYRFKGRKGQRVILMPDSWPEDSHGCLRLAGMRLDGRKLAKGALGDWRLPRTATYDLRVGRFCVEELSLRLRRHEQPRVEVGGELPTRFTRTLLRSPRLTPPRKGTVIFEQPGEGRVYIAPSRSRWPGLGCGVHVATFGRRLCSVSGTMTREVVVSAPVPGRTRMAKVVDVTVGGPAVTIVDPSRTLVRVGLDAGAAVTIETNAVPVPRTLAQRDWVELTAPTRGWTTGINTYRTRSSDETWVPSGWTVSQSGSYAFQLVDQGAVPAQPLTFAVRASTNPPPGELEPVVSPYDDRVATQRRHRAAKPLVRIGEVLEPSPGGKYRFRGTKGQRVVLMPDGWPEQTHNCLRHSLLRFGDSVVRRGVVGEWRLPRTATYELRVGRFCVEELALRLRRHEQPRGHVGSTLPTLLTRTLLRTVRVRLPRKRTVLIGRPDGGEVHVATSLSDGQYALGCPIRVMTSSPEPCNSNRRMTRRVVISSPVPSTVEAATIVDASVDGPAVTIDDPTRTLVRIELDGPSELRVETNAVPVPHAEGERDWLELVEPTRGWLPGIDTHRTPGPGDTWLPWGWSVANAGSYVFQVVDQAAVPVGEPLRFAVRTGAATARQARAAKPLVRIGEVLEPSPTQRYRFRGRKGQRVILQPDGWPSAGHGCVGDERMYLAGKRLRQGSIGDFRLPRTATYELRVGRFCVDRLPLRLRRHQQPRIAVEGATPSALPTRFTRTLMRSVRLTLPKDRAVLLGQEDGARPVLLASVKRDVGTFVGCLTTVTTAGKAWTCGPGRVPREVLVSAPGPSTAVVAKVVDAAVDGPAVTITHPARTLVRVEVTARTALRVESNATPVPHTLSERDWVELMPLDGRYWYDVSTYRTPAAEDDHWIPSGWIVAEPGEYVFQVVDPASWPAEEPLTLAVRTSVDPPPGEVEEIVYPD